METHPCVSVIVTKGNNLRDFLFTSMMDEAVSKRVLLLKERIRS